MRCSVTLILLALALGPGCSIDPIVPFSSGPAPVDGCVAQAEICDGRDNDCNPSTLDGADEAWLGEACDGADEDQCDTGQFGCQMGAQACIETSASIPEVCGGGDEDCDGMVDEDGGAIRYYIDADRDGFGTSDEMYACEPRAGLALETGDCDDGRADVNPGAGDACGDLTDTDCTGIADDGGDCACQAYWHDGRQYIACTDSITWDEARNACVVFGGTLASISDAADVAFLDFIRQSRSPGEAYWLGLHQNNDRRWVWQNGEGSDPAVIPWKSGEPSNTWCGVLRGNEACAELNRFGDETWNDACCDMGNSYICEI